MSGDLGEQWCPADPVGYTLHDWQFHLETGVAWQICVNCQAERNLLAGGVPVGRDEQP